MVGPLATARAGMWALMCLFGAYAVLALSVSVKELSSEPRAVASAACLFVAAHLVRAVRLGALLEPKRLRILFQIYWAAAAFSTLLPFKIGDAGRVMEFAHAERSLARGIVVVWLERMFDALALSALMLLMAIGGAVRLDEMAPIAVALLAVGFLSVVLLWVIPENMRSLNLHVMRLYTGRKAIRLLTVLNAIGDALGSARSLVSERIVTLSLLSAMVWSLELLALSALSHALSSGAHGIRGLFATLSILLTSNWQAIGDPLLRQYLLAQQVIIFALAVSSFALSRLRRNV